MLTSIALQTILRPPSFAQLPTGGDYNAGDFSAFTPNETTKVTGFLAPDGSHSATILTENSNNANHYLDYNFTMTVLAKAYTFSAYVKRAYGSRDVELYLHNAAGTGYVDVSLATGAILTAAAVTGAWTSPSAVVTPYPNGWFKIALTVTTTTNTAVSMTFPILDSTVSSIYQGNGQHGITLWGANLR